jgi:hypothetical protein
VEYTLTPCPVFRDQLRGPLSKPNRNTFALLRIAAFDPERTFLTLACGDGVLTARIIKDLFMREQ